MGASTKFLLNSVLNGVMGVPNQIDFQPGKYIVGFPNQPPIKQYLKKCFGRSQFKFNDPP
jgi:hypothetical protein